jgi:hypothetical protein
LSIAAGKIENSPTAQLSVLTDYTSQKVKRFDVNTLEKLCKYLMVSLGICSNILPRMVHHPNKKNALFTGGFFVMAMCQALLIYDV